MAHKITQIDARRVPELNGMTQSSFRGFLRWPHDKKVVVSNVIDPFKQGLLGRIGYSDDNRPKGQTVSRVGVGDVRFNVTTTPQDKSPSYKEVNETFGEYLEFLSEQHGSDVKRKGIRTFEGSAYVDVDVVLEKLNELNEESRRGKSGINQKIEVASPEDVVKYVPDRIGVVLGQNYSALTDFNARGYSGAINFVKEGDKKSGEFKSRVLEQSLETLGVDSPSEVSVVGYAFEGFTVHHQLEPRSTRSHSKIIDALTKEPGVRLTKSSKIGDLHKVRMMGEGATTQLYEKGLVDDSFVEDYSPVVRDGKDFVRIDGLQKRFEGYKNSLKSESLEQNFGVFFA